MINSTEKTAVSEATSYNRFIEIKSSLRSKTQLRLQFSWMQFYLYNVKASVEVRREKET